MPLHRERHLAQPRSEGSLRRALTLTLGAFAALVLLSPALGGCSGGRGGGSGSFGSGLPAVEASSEILALERAMFDRLNRDRAGKGLGPLAYDEELAAVGRFHSNDMKTHKFFAHDSPTSGSLEDRLDRAGYLAAIARENLAEGPNVDGAEDSLLQSPGHYANIMAEDITHVGIGIVKGGVEDPRNLTITQVFATPAEEQSPGEAKQTIVARIQEGRQKAGAPPAQVHPVLQRLADEHIDELPADVDEAAADAIGDAVAKALNETQGHGLGGVAVTAARVISASRYEVPGILLTPKVRQFGLAVAEGKDERGRPAMKVLLLIGQ